MLLGLCRAYHLMTLTERFTLGELWRKLYGCAEHPDDTGDIPEMKADIAAIKADLNDLLGFYRTVIRAGKITTALTSIAALAALVSGAIPH